MHRQLLPLVAALGSLAASRPASGAPLGAADRALVEGLRSPVELHRLDNGLQVVVVPDHRAPFVTLHLQVPFGAARDTGQPGWPDTPGLAHLVEHLLYAGSVHAPRGAYDALLAATGGENNAWTEHDYMAVHATVPAEALELALFLESDRMVGLDPESLAARLEPERQVVAQERAIDLDTPGALDPAARLALLHPPGHPDHWPVLGSPAALDRVQPDHVVAFHAAAFAPGHAVLVLVGAVDPATALPLVERWLGAVPARPVPEPLPPPPPPELPARATFFDDVAGVTLYAIYPLPPAAHPDAPAATLLADWLGQQRHGHLGRLRQRGRLQRLSAWVEPGPRAGRLVVEVATRRGPSTRLLRHLDRAVAELAAAPPADQELERVRARWRTWAARAPEDPEGRAELVAHCVLELGEPDCFADHVARHLAVEPDQLSAAAATWLSPERRGLLVVLAPVHARWALPGAEELDLSELWP